MNIEDKITILITAKEILKECLRDRDLVGHELDTEYGHDPMGVCQKCGFVDIRWYINDYIEELRK